MRNVKCSEGDGQRFRGNVMRLRASQRYASLTNRERQVLRLVACATSSQPQNWVSVDSPYRYTGARSCKKCRPVRSRTWRGWLKR